MSGRGIREAEVWRTEQMEVRERTSDPTTTANGDAWVRSDIQPVTDSVAELRIQGPGGLLKAPLFASSVESSLGSDVYVGQRYLFADGTEGLLLVTDQGGAVGSPRVVTSAGTVYETHDALEVIAIPDSVVHQYRFEQNGNDSVGSLDASEVGAPSYTATNPIEGDYSAVLDGTDDYYDLGSNVNVNATVDGIAFEFSIDLSDNTSGSFFELNDQNTRWVCDLDSSDQVRFFVRGSSTTILESTGFVPNTGQVYDIVAQYDSSIDTLELYIDESKKNDETLGHSLDNPSSTNYIGNATDQQDNPISANRLDDFRVHDQPIL